MKNLYLMLMLFISGLMSAQTFDFACADAPVVDPSVWSPSFEGMTEDFTQSRVYEGETQTRNVDVLNPARYSYYVGTDSSTIVSLDANNLDAAKRELNNEVSGLGVSTTILSRITYVYRVIFPTLHVEQGHQADGEPISHVTPDGISGVTYFNQNERGITISIAGVAGESFGYSWTNGTTGQSGQTVLIPASGSVILDITDTSSSITFSIDGRDYVIERRAEAGPLGLSASSTSITAGETVTFTFSGANDGANVSWWHANPTNVEAGLLGRRLPAGNSQSWAIGMVGTHIVYAYYQGIQYSVTVTVQ